MKKSTLALSVAAALAGLGFMSGASAMTDPPAGATAGSAMVVNPNGVGHQLLFPYYTAQSDNATLINITNTDTTNGKVVKVRFRAASNSDDVYDFTLLLSPGDVWSAAVSKDAATGLAKLDSRGDVSCVLPATANNGNFVTSRIDPQNSDRANQTREGYIEVITMANVPVNGTSGTPAGGAGVDTLYEAIKHVNNVAPCTASVLDTALGTDAVDNTAALARGMTPPTTGLMGDWVILNQVNTAAWSGSATALENRAAGVAAAANLVFWPQKFGTPTYTNTNTITTVTADPLLVNSLLIANGTGGGTIQWYDLPDLSTAYDATDNAAAVATRAATRADATTALISRTSLKHQFATTTDIGAVTDVLFSQPTRRYSVAVNYAAAAATDNGVGTTGTTASAIYRGLGAGTGRYTQTNTSLVSRQVCLDTVNAPGVQNVFNREETSPTVGSTSFVISPNDPSAATILRLCGEASVVSINQGGVASPSAALSATIGRSDVTFDSAYTLGWANWDFTTANAAGLPIIGATFMRAKNGTVNYGFAFPHKN